MAAEERVKNKAKEEISIERENPNVDIDRFSVSYTSSSSSATISDSKWESDQMVKIELDAARALADFAQLALLERENPNGESGSKWGHKGRRSKKRVKNEITVGDWGKNLESSKLNPTSPNPVQQDYSIETKPSDKKVLRNVEVKTIKAEQDFELPTPTRTCPKNRVAFSGGRSKQHLTEAEKEARRLRRVLANRESARQTIRRRQAMCEALTKKAAELALDNVSMRREKDSVMKEYQSLKDKNKQLKSQLAKAKVGIEEEAPSTMAGTPASSSENLPLDKYKGAPLTPFIWPSIMQPSIAQNAARLQETVPANGKSDPFQEHENSSCLSTNAPKPPFYVVPCPWFFPLPDHGSQLHHRPLDSCGSTGKKYDSFVGKIRETGSSSKSVENVDTHQPLFDRKIKTDPCSSTEAGPTNSLPVSSLRLPTDRGGHPERLIFMHAPPFRSVEHQSSVKSEIIHPEDITSKADIVCSTSSHVSIALPETMREVSTYTTNKKLKDAAAAAEARNRRKELTKMKSHSRQVRLRG